MKPSCAGLCKDRGVVVRKVCDLDELSDVEDFKACIQQHTHSAKTRQIFGVWVDSAHQSTSFDKQILMAQKLLSSQTLNQQRTRTYSAYSFCLSKVVKVPLEKFWENAAIANRPHALVPCVWWCAPLVATATFHKTQGCSGAAFLRKTWQARRRFKHL